MPQGRFENLSSWKHFLGITTWPENTFVLIFLKKQLWDNKEELDKTLISMGNK